MLDNYEVTIAAVTAVAAVIWWAARMAYNVGRIRTALEGTLVQHGKQIRQLRRGHRTVRQTVEQHQRCLADHEPRIFSLEQFRSGGTVR